MTMMTIATTSATRSLFDVLGGSGVRGGCLLVLAFVEDCDFGGGLLASEFGRLGALRVGGGRLWLAVDSRALSARILSYARPICLNRKALPSIASGWFFLDRTRYLLVTSSKVAEDVSPKTS